jgi:acyl-CoA synthetase (AMP-forming)/AMP-acid ligase II
LGEWFTTGDVGSMEDNLLTIHGRADSMFISGGENIHPAELERVLAGHPEIEEVVVVGIPDDRWGARPAAFVRPHLDLTAWAKGHLPPFGIPALWLALPQTQEKPDRAELRRRAIAAQKAPGAADG